MVAYMALAAALDLSAPSMKPEKVQQIAQQVEDRLIAVAEVTPSLNAM